MINVLAGHDRYVWEVGLWLYLFPSVVAAHVAQYDTNALRFRFSYFNATAVTASVQQAGLTPSMFGSAFQTYHFQLSHRTSRPKQITGA